MKHKFFYAIIVLLFISSFVKSQNSDYLLKIGNNKISSSEFMHIYNKNNNSDFEKKNIDEYLELFINFKLKVAEAQSLKKDTTKVFKDELTGYKIQLSKHYVVENEILEKQIKRAYERNKTEIKFDHILIKVEDIDDATKKNMAYQKAMKIKARLTAGEDFEKIVAEVSDDKSASRTKGHMWYMAAAKIPLKIQEFGISAEIGQFSDPLLTKYGYHLVKVVDRRPALGSVKVAHIMVLSPEDATDDQKEKSKRRIDSIYAKISAGEKFENLVSLSEDKGTADKGGELPWFTTGRMVPEFEVAAFELKKPGDISKPIQTAFGWHIIKLLEQKGFPSFEESEKSIKKMIESDNEMQEESKEYVLKKLKQEFVFTELSSPAKLAGVLDSSIFAGEWKVGTENDLTTVLFEIKNDNSNKSQEKIKFNELDLANFIENNQKKQKACNFKDYVNQSYSDFVYKTLTDSEIESLDEKNQEFKFLMNEYYDGILLFDIMDSVVWQKAVKDSIGLKKYYEANKEDYNSIFKMDLSIFQYSSKKILKKAKPVITNKKSENLSDEQVIDKVSAKDADFKLLEAGVFAENENAIADKVIELKKAGKIIENQKFVLLEDENLIIALNNIEEQKLKSLDEIKGIIIADYQNYLESEWIKQLRKKFKVEINQESLKKLKK